MRRFAVILVATILLLWPSSTWAQIDHYSVVADEVAHILRQGFSTDPFGWVAMDPDWEGASTSFSRKVIGVIVVIADNRRMGHTRATTAHEVGHRVVEYAGLDLPAEEEEAFVQRFAVCFGSHSAQVWLRIREGVRATRAECDAIRVQLRGTHADAD